MNSNSESSDSEQQHPHIALQALKKQHDHYFACYTQLSIHETMLKDQIRTLAYKNAIESNKHLFEGKTVLDIGSGTLILSLMASQYAKKVYAVQFSGINRFSQQILSMNNKNNIVVISNKIQNVNDQIPEQVDIIISQWMGYGLFFEDMIKSVLYAAQKWLKPEGIVFPCKAKVYLAAAKHPFLGQYLRLQNDTLQDLVSKSNSRFGLQQLNFNQLMHGFLNGYSESKQMINQQSEAFQNQYFKSQFKIKGSETIIDHFIFWFQVQFPGGSTLLTGPLCPVTHWKQCVIFLQEPFVSTADITGCFSIGFHPKHWRKIKADLEFSTVDKNHKMTYFMV